MRAPRAQSLCLAQFYPTQGPTNRAGQSILQGFLLSRLVRVSYQKDRKREWTCYSYRSSVSLAQLSESIYETALKLKILSKLQTLLRVIVGRRCDTDQLHQVKHCQIFKDLVFLCLYFVINIKTIIHIEEFPSSTFKWINDSEINDIFAGGNICFISIRRIFAKVAWMVIVPKDT